MSLTLGMALALAAGNVGFCGHHERGKVVTTCDADPAIARDVAILGASPRWRDRDNAAHRLGKADWRRYPEVPMALCRAMLHDCEEEVREEAAESLKKLKPCVPEVHEALARAASGDPDFATRHQARKALKSLGKSCQGPCNVCQPGVLVEQRETIVIPPGEPVLEVPAPIRPEDIPPVPVPAEEIPSLPAPLPGAAPFGDVPQASRKAETRVAGQPRGGIKTGRRDLIIRRRTR